MQGKKYIGLSRIWGPLVVIEGVKDIGYDEMVEITDSHGERKLGRVLEVRDDITVVQMFGPTQGLSISNTQVKFTGEPFKLLVSREMVGRVFNGIGQPIDDGPPLFTSKKLNINGEPINPTAREYPHDFIQTGISAIDGLNTLVRGQKLPIFSANGLPHDQLATQIVRQAKLLDEEQEFVVIFAAMGVKYDVAEFFRQSFESAGTLDNVVMFINLADDPPIERLVTPRCALTAAEYLAFEEDFHVLVILIDMTNYAEALREISSAREEVPSRKGYPGYLYSDLASLYERTGRIKTSKGSITQIPVLTMPNDDINHPIPDLTGYITEGQIVLNRDLHQKGIYPPITVLPSLSRLMKDGIGEGRTRSDHQNIASQLYASYSNVQSVRALASVIGEEELSDLDKRYLNFGEKFEREFLNQGQEEDRSIEQTLDISWEIVRELLRSQLHRVTEEQLDQYYGE